MKSKRADVNQTKDMKESLRIADDIRRKLKGRQHTDSTKLVSEDRGFADDSSTERDFTMQELLAGITKENRHAEVDFGRPVGKEKC
jgi:antitoxin component of MazEF toxin-antitoxin module